MAEHEVEGEGAGMVKVAEGESEVAVLRARLLQSELRAAGIKAGIIDLDAIKLVDASTLKTTETGELVDGAGVMRALRASKPYLFGGSSSSSAVAPRAVTASDVKPAMAMSTEEWRAARASLLRRR